MDLEQGETGGVAGGEVLAGQQLAFERGEEAFRQGVVEAVAATAHRAEQPRFAQALSAGQACGPGFLDPSGGWRRGPVASATPPW